MRKILTITQVTFKEMIRQPIFGVVLFLSSVLIYISPFFSMFTLLNSVKLVRDMGLATILLSDILIAAFCASGLVFRELENKTSLTVLSKPVSRFEFILGKFLGLGCGTMLAVMQMTLVLILTLRMGVLDTAADILDKPVLYFLNSILPASFLWAALLNYFFEKPFTSSLVITFFVLLALSFLAISVISPDFHLQSFAVGMELRLFKAGILIFLALNIVNAVALLGSIRLNMLANMLLCLSFFFMSMTVDYFFGKLAAENFFMRFLYLIMPNLQFFWIADAFLNNKIVSFYYMGVTFAYSIVCIVFVLILSWFSFSEKEVA